MPWLHCEAHGSAGLADARAARWAKDRPGESLRIARGRLRIDCLCDRCNCPLERGAVAYLFLSYPRVTPYPDTAYRREYFGKNHEVWVFPTKTGLTRMRYPPRPPETIPSGVLLDVPFADKDQAKALGARWARWLRRWYIPAGVDPAPFGRWLPDPGRAIPAPLPPTGALSTSPHILPPAASSVPRSGEPQRRLPSETHRT